MADRTAIAERDAAPVGWEASPLSDDVTLISGQHVLARHVNTRGVGMPYLTGPADFPHGVIAQTKFTTHPSKACRAGDILVTVKGSGSGTLVRADATYCISRQLMSIRPSGWDASFLYYSLLQNAGRIKEASTGLIPGLSRSDILGQRIPIPNSPAEQRRIAASLRDADALIAALERTIAKKQAIKQGMMQQLLTGKSRLPGFTAPWQTRRLSDMLSYEQPGRYLVQTTKQLDAGRVPVLTAGKTFVLGYTNETHGVYTDHPVIIFDDFTTASKYVNFDFKAKSSAMKVLSARYDVDLRFIYERMQLIDFTLGDHKRYWISEYSKQELDVPDPAEQKAISSVIADCDEEIDLLKRRLVKAQATKTGTMQELLTGRTRLPVKVGAA